jgi:hypothetical protein
MYIITKEGDKLAISPSVIEHNILLQEIFEDDHCEISLSMVNTKDLVRVIQFCNYYDRNPFTPFLKPITKFNIEDSWYHTFVDLPREELFNLIHVANYLDNQPLLELLSAKISTMMRGLSLSEVREFLL